MPHIAVSSNVKASDVDSARAIREISKTLSAVLEHAEDSFMVQLSLDQNIIFGGADVVRTRTVLVWLCIRIWLRLLYAMC